MKKTFVLEKFSTTLGEGMFSDLNDAPSRELVNFLISGRRLVDGIRPCRPPFGDMSLPQGVTPCGFAVADTAYGEIMFLAGWYGDAVRVYSAVAGGEFTMVENVSFTSDVAMCKAFVSGRQCVLAADSGGHIAMFDGVAAQSGTCPENVAAISTFGDRIVAVGGDSVYLSATDDPFTLGESLGGLQFSLGRGFGAGGAVEAGNALLVVGANAIAELTVDWEEETFTAEKTFTGGETIFPETLCAGGEGAFVMTDGGLLVYDGVSASFSHRRSGRLAGGGVCGFMLDGRYVACVKARENAQKRLLLRFYDDSVEVAEVSVAAACRSQSAGIVLAVGGIQRVFCFEGRPYAPVPQGRFISADTDFGIGSDKTITSFSLYTKRSVNVTIYADGKPHRFRVEGGGRRSVRTFIRGRVFSFSISVEEADSVLSKLSVSYEYAQTGR